VNGEQKKMKTNLKEHTRKKRQISVRRKVMGTASCPRLCVKKSTRHIYVQLFDDIAGKSLTQVTSNTKELKKNGKKSFRNVETAANLGKLIAEKALEKNIKTAKFDRSGYKYHGCVKALADAARKAGLKI